MRAQGKNPIVLDLGNTFFKLDPVPTSKEEAYRAFAELIAQSHKLMKPDAVTVGPKDFVLGVEPLKQWLATIGAPVLAGNVLDAATGKPLFSDSLVIERNGTKIGFFGVVSAEWLKVPGKSEKLGIVVRDPVAYAKETFAALKGQADIIFALSSLDDGEIGRLSEAVTDLKYILRSNARGGYYRGNKSHGFATEFTVINRGKAVGLLRFVEKDGDTNYVDITERKLSEQRKQRYEKNIKNLLMRENVASVNQLRKKLPADDPKIVRLDRYLEKAKSLDQDMKKFASVKSYFELDTMYLDSAKPSDLALKKQVDAVIQKYGEPGKLKPKAD